MKKADETKELYGIYQGCIFEEGGGFEQQLYRTIEEARKAVLEIINKSEDKDEWVERRPDSWDNGYYCIIIQTFYFETTTSNTKDEFSRCLELLRDLADLQNGPPLETYRKEWKKTMSEVYDFLNKYEKLLF